MLLQLGDLSVNVCVLDYVTTPKTIIVHTKRECWVLKKYGNEAYPSSASQTQSLQGTPPRGHRVPWDRPRPSTPSFFPSLCFDGARTTIGCGCLVTTSNLCPFLSPRIQLSGKGREYGAKMENNKITFAMILELYKPSVIARNGLGPPSCKVGQSKSIEMLY